MNSFPNKLFCDFVYQSSHKGCACGPGFEGDFCEHKIDDISNKGDGSDSKSIIIIIACAIIFSALATAIVVVVVKRKRGQEEKQTKTDKEFGAAEKSDGENVSVV